MTKHKRIGGNGLWGTLCGKFALNSLWFNTWPAVNCKRCLKLKGTTRDYLESKREAQLLGWR